MNKKPTISYPPVHIRPKAPEIKHHWLIDRIANVLYWFESLFEEKGNTKSGISRCGTYRYKIRDDVLAQWDADDKERMTRTANSE